MRNVKRIIPAVVLSLAGFMQPAQADVTVGALYPLSGEFALLGNESFRGLELAIDEQNARGGIKGQKIAVVKYDAVDPKGAVSGAKHLTSKNVTAIFGTFSSALSYAATPVAELAGVPYFELGATAHPIVTRGYKYIFRSNPDTSIYGIGVVDSLDKVIAPGLKMTKDQIRIGIIHEDGPYGSDIARMEAEHAKKLGYTVVQNLAYSSSSVDMSSLVLRLKGAKANVILHTGYQSDTVLFFKQSKTASYRPEIVIGAGSGYSLKSTASAIGEDFNHVFNLDFPQMTINEANAPGLAEFVKAYQARYGEKPRAAHSLANYVGAKYFFEVLSNSKSFGKDDVRSAAYAYRAPEGKSANGWGFELDKLGQNQAAHFYLSQWQNGELVTIAPSQYANAKPIFQKLR